MVGLGMVAALAAGGQLSAQENPRPGGGPGGPGGAGRGGPRGDFLERFVNGAGEFYKLSDEQKAAMRTLLEERAPGTQERWSALGKYWQEARRKAESGEEVDWAALREKVMATPEGQEAQKYMEETRTLFRDKVLNDAQKKIYDDAKGQGLDPMTGREQFGGGFSSAERAARRFTGKGFEEAAWQRWLDRVASAAKLTPDQISQAKEMLELAKEAAAQYRKDKESQYKEMAAALAKLKDEKDADKKKSVEKAAEELAAPIDGIGKKWKDDVLAMLDETQKKAVEGIDRAGRGGPGGRGRGGPNRGGDGQKPAEQ
jgi:hypothetical protein